MPRTGITAYDLLISCPGDVLQYAEIVKECVESFNHTLGCINNAEIVTRHWATDSFPQSGDRPQELLNKQFVRDCDAAVAIFWTNLEHLRISMDQELKKKLKRCYLRVNRFFFIL